MSTTVKVIVFGVVNGLLWSLAPGGLNNLFLSKDAALVCIAGMLTGIAVSLALKAPLTRFGRGWALIFGLVSLPLGAFIFGVIFSILDVSAWLNGSQYGIFNVFLIGGYYALLSIISIFAIILLPLAVLTTFILRSVIHSGKNQAH
ncbi:MAG: hypothetical protein WDM80_07730 [Limisphaerales bacterium]